MDIEISYDNLLVYKKGYTREMAHSIINENKLNGLRIFSELKSDRLESINFLEDYTFLEHLDITSVSDFNFNFLSKLGNLRKLTINVSGTNEIDLRGQIKLEHLSIQGRKQIKGLDNCKCLSSLGLIALKEKDLSRLADLKSLIDIRIKTGSIETLNGLDELLRLESLLVANCRRLTSIKSINQLPNLHHLEFNACSSIIDFESVNSLPTIQSISFVNCGELGSIKFIENYPSLSKVSLLGNTVIRDGNLLPAKRLSSFEHKHYNHYNIKLDDRAYNQTISDNLQRIKKLIKK